MLWVSGEVALHGGAEIGDGHFSLWPGSTKREEQESQTPTVPGPQGLPQAPSLIAPLPPMMPWCHREASNFHTRRQWRYSGQETQAIARDSLISPLTQSNRILSYPVYLKLHFV